MGKMEDHKSEPIIAEDSDDNGLDDSTDDDLMLARGQSMNHRKHHTNAVKSKRGMGKFGGAKKRALTKHRSRRHPVLGNDVTFSRIESNSLHIVDEHYDEQIESQSEEEKDEKNVRCE